ncbi:MAG: TonB-dependent receptor [Rhodothermaceae bacterium]|nr:MAG: TonB-dependent receptor [Rhodothermaceae bacterium]
MVFRRFARIGSVLPGGRGLWVAGLLGCLLVPAVRGQPAVLSGFVTDATDGQPIELVNVALQDAGGAFKGAVTNRDGLYLIPNLAPGRYLLQVSFIGYRTLRDTLLLRPGERRRLNLSLVPGEAAMDEVVVETERTTGAANLTAGQQTVRPRDIELIPAPDLSGDLAGLLTALPGIVTLGDRGGQLFIRGGEPSQNLVQIDGVLLYQPFHILGFYSAFPADIISRTDIYAGGYGSRFGERISSVIDVSTRNGNNRAFAGAVTLSPFVTAALLEGPLVRDRFSFLLSARQSLVEEGAEPLVGRPLPFDFGDVFAKVHGHLGRSSRLSALFIRTHDRGALDEDSGDLPPEEVRWNNLGLGLRLVSLPGVSPLMLDARLSYSRLPTELGLPGEEPVRASRIENLHVAADATFFGDVSNVDAGLSFRIVRLRSRLGGLYQNIEERRERLEHAAVYVEPELHLAGGWRLRPGLRVQFFDVRFSPFLEPRLRLIWARGPHQVSLAAGLYHQAVLGLNDRRDAASVFTAWTNVPRPRTDLEDVRAGLAPRARHGLLGYRLTPASWLELSLEGFYKDLTNLFIAEWTAFPRFTTNLQPAEGRTFGFDARLEVRTPRFYGYLTYGYAHTRYEARQASLILWYGTETLAFHPPHDRRHQVNALAAFTLGGVEVSLRWAFGSGLPFSQAIGFDGFVLVDDVTSVAERPGSRRVIYARPFNARLPTYHRLDLSVEKSLPLGPARLTLQGSLINVYDRRNIFFLDVFTLRRADQLPLFPSVGLKLAYE